MPDDMLERKASDPRIIRHLRKVWSIRENALMIPDVQHQRGSFGKFIAQWPSSDIIGLWQYFKKPRFPSWRQHRPLRTESAG